MDPWMIAYAAAVVWAVFAYLTAAYAGLRVLSIASNGHAPRPMCLIVDATRWLFGLSPSQAAWTPRDFLRLGVFAAVMVCFMRAALVVEAGWPALEKPPTPYMIRSAILHALTGSALIILHCGLGLHFRKERIQ